MSNNYAVSENHLGEELGLGGGDLGGVDDGLGGDSGEDGGDGEGGGLDEGSDGGDGQVGGAGDPEVISNE